MTKFIFTKNDASLNGYRYKQLKKYFKLFDLELEACYPRSYCFREYHVKSLKLEFLNLKDAANWLQENQDISKLKPVSQTKEAKIPTKKLTLRELLKVK